jgi:predicted ATPase
MTHISGYDRSQILLLPEVVAGESALRRSAIIEAVTHLTRGIELISSLPAGPDRDGTELHLQLALGTVMWAAKGQSAPETLRVLFPRS